MEDLLYSNVFFFITSIAVVAVSVCFVIALYYVIGILHNVRDITDRVDRKSSELEEDVTALRNKIKENIRERGLQFKYVVTYFLTFFRRLHKKYLYKYEK